MAGVLLGMLLAAAWTAPAVPPSLAGDLPATTTWGAWTLRAADTNLATIWRRHAQAMQRGLDDILKATVPSQLVVGVFADSNAWSRFAREVGGGEGNRGLSGADFVVVSASDRTAIDALAHEMVHVAIKQMTDRPVPLWMEEGLAYRLGRMVAQTADPSRINEIPALPLDSLLAADHVLNATDYPTDPVRMRSFCRQSEELAGLVWEAGPPDDIRQVMRRLGRGDSLRDCMKKQFKYDAKRWEELLDAMRVRSTTAQRR